VKKKHELQEWEQIKRRDERNEKKRRSTPPPPPPWKDNDLNYIFSFRALQFHF
jgi:hypothetical protein